MMAYIGIAAGEIGREEIVEGIHGDDCVAYVAENLAQPVSPSDEEPNERTEPLSAIHVDPRFEIRSDVGKDAKGIRQEKHSDTRHDPSDDHSPYRSLGCHILGQAINATPHH